MNAIAKTPTSILSLSPDTIGEISQLKLSLASFADVEITDANFSEANGAVAKSAKIKKAIEAEAKDRKRELDGQKKLIDGAVNSALGELTTALQPINRNLAAYAARKEEERQAAIAETRRIEAEERARKAEEARIAAEARAEAARQAAEARRIEMERLAALRAGEPPPPAPIVPAPAPAPEPWDEPEAVEPEVVSASLGRVTPVAKPVIPAAVKTAVRTRTIQRLEIFNEAAIPAIASNGAVLRKVDEAAVRAALKADVDVPGARLIEETVNYNA